MNNYYLKARFLPTVLTCIPLYISVHSVIIAQFGPVLEPIRSILPMLSTFGISAALVFIMTQLNRVLSKEIFQRFYFKDEENMPTTNFLLLSDNYYETHIKEKLRLKIQSDYDIQLHDLADETADELSARKRILFATSQIRNSLRNNDMLFRHNLEYGFFRNLLGGCVLAILIACGLCAYGFIKHDNTLFTTGYLLIIIYLIPILMSKKIMTIYGNNYAKILHEQFLSL
ncbi:hypothetical protein [Pedobacter sp. CFBP9032]|uniref:hypothetical protein n=1 Tax=Pedobacter sp. CFBP9032 TaxID=3096539 RepID=UPI002A6B075B|nr:hypothetical protein [Pedobacter sp. CFBP9032]MDY0904306.1 hypothetical protein [Pedobacter sp. CFBP9032]